MENRGFTFRLDDIINKMKKLRQKYKMEKDKKNKSGSGRNKPWKFFGKLDEILATRPNTQPHVVIDSSLVHAETSGVASEVEDDQESPNDQESPKDQESIKDQESLQDQESLKDQEGMFNFSHGINASLYMLYNLYFLQLDLDIYLVIYLIYQLRL